MINIAYNPNFLLSLIVLISMLLFYLLRIIRPEVSKEEDIFFISLGLLYSCIILIHGWRLDPILFFSQVLLVIIVVCIGWENIRLRGLLVKIFEKDD
uniref:Ycf66 n=1 Tax=Merotricha bacillata TaxID=658122 RepID=UPI002114B82B|nr:Ycf66 [Merotricha bacillata]UTE94559.1 Ycf66 [Merotricha bacillata]